MTSYPGAIVRTTSTDGRRTRTTQHEAYREHMARAAAGARVRRLQDDEWPFAGASAEVADRLVARVEQLEDELFALVVDMYENPEIGFEEVRTVGTIAQLLRRHGVEVEVGTYGLPTSFRAVAGTGRPRIAILAEYDALPGVGHGCGHNIIAATAIGAFLAVRDVVAQTGGAVELIGTPAEEGGGGKEYVLAAGGFDQVDAAIMLHPGSKEDVVAHLSSTGRRQVEVVYTGQASHAAGRPYLGRNALDAVVMAYQGLAQLRQHMLPTDRLHAVITDGGHVPNVIPERAALMGYVRSLHLDTLAVLSDRVEDVFHAAAHATGTQCTITWDITPPYLPLRQNLVLGSRYIRALAGRRDVLLTVDPGEASGSTDMGNVTQYVPGIHPSLTFIPPSIPGHSSQLADQTVTPAGRRAVVDGAIGLARTAADFLSDADLRAEVAREFAASGGRARASDAFGAG